MASDDRSAVLEGSRDHPLGDAVDVWVTNGRRVSGQTSMDQAQGARFGRFEIARGEIPRDRKRRDGVETSEGRPNRTMPSMTRCEIDEFEGMIESALERWSGSGPGDLGRSTRRSPSGQ